MRIGEDGAELRVWVVPGASRTGLAGLHDGALRIRVAAPPEGGAANRALCRYLAKMVGGRVTVTAGTTSRAKTLRVEGVAPQELVAALDPGPSI